MHVFHHFHIKHFRVHIDGAQARNQSLVATNAGVEIHQTFLQVTQFQKVVVAQASLQSVFRVVDADIDLLQEFQEPHSRLHNQSQNERKLVVDGVALRCVVLYEVVNHDVFEISQHNHQVAVGDHTKWHGGEWYVQII